MQEAGWAGESYQAGYGLWQAPVFYGCGRSGLLVAVCGRHYHLLFYYLYSILSLELVPSAQSLPPFFPALPETQPSAETQKTYDTCSIRMHSHNPCDPPASLPHCPSPCLSREHRSGPWEVGEKDCISAAPHPQLSLSLTFGLLFLFPLKV